MRLQIALVALSLAIPTTPSAAQEIPLATGCVLRLASEAEGQAALAKVDAFVAQLSPFDRAARLRTDRVATQAEYLEFVGRQVQSWTAEEHALLREAAGLLTESLDKHAVPLPPQVLLIKTTGAEEGQAAYTRGAAIVLPQRKIGPAPGLARLLAHELFHVVSRREPELREKLYRLVGFELIEPLRLPDDLEKRRITNPDAPLIDVRLKLTHEGETLWGAPVLLSKAEKYDLQRGGEFFQYLEFRLLVVTPPEENRPRHAEPLRKEGELRWLDPRRTPDYLKQTARNTQYILHPDEVLADNFVLLLLPTNNELADPQLPAAMAAEFKSRAER